MIDNIVSVIFRYKSTFYITFNVHGQYYSIESVWFSEGWGWLRVTFRVSLG